MTDRQPTGKDHLLAPRTGSYRVVDSRAERSHEKATDCEKLRSHYPFGFVMCRERNIKGLLRWVHQGLLLFITSGQQASSTPSRSPCVISCPGHRLDPVGLRYRGCQVPGGDGLSRPQAPPPGNLPRGFSRPATACIRLGALWGSGLWWSELSSAVKRQTCPWHLGTDLSCVRRVDQGQTSGDTASGFLIRPGTRCNTKPSITRYQLCSRVSIDHEHWTT